MLPSELMKAVRLCATPGDWFMQSAFSYVPAARRYRPRAHFGEPSLPFADVASTVTLVAGAVQMNSYC
eukprot:4456590-Pleurochrysis_carterae.AAC.1